MYSVNGNGVVAGIVVIQQYYKKSLLNMKREMSKDPKHYEVKTMPSHKKEVTEYESAIKKQIEALEGSLKLLPDNQPIIDAIAGIKAANKPVTKTVNVPGETKKVPVSIEALELEERIAKVNKIINWINAEKPDFSERPERFYIEISEEHFESLAESASEYSEEEKA